MNINNKINADGSITVSGGGKTATFDPMHTVVQAIELFIKYELREDV